ncbi:hypothetical protein ABPG75_008059 [Micractinium tetrahymenae]
MAAAPATAQLCCRLCAQPRRPGASQRLRAPIQAECRAMRRLQVGAQLAATAAVAPPAAAAAAAGLDLSSSQRMQSLPDNLHLPQVDGLQRLADGDAGQAAMQALGAAAQGVAAAAQRAVAPLDVFGSGLLDLLFWGCLLLLAYSIIVLGPRQ